MCTQEFSKREGGSKATGNNNNNDTPKDEQNIKYDFELIQRKIFNSEWPNNHCCHHPQHPRDPESASALVFLGFLLLVLLMFSPMSAFEMSCFFGLLLLLASITGSALMLLWASLALFAVSALLLLWSSLALLAGRPCALMLLRLRSARFSFYIHGPCSQKAAAFF